MVFDKSFMVFDKTFIIFDNYCISRIREYGLSSGSHYLLAFGLNKLLSHEVGFTRVES